MHNKILLKFLLLSFLFVFSLNAKQSSNITIVAKNIELKNNIITASGDVLIYSPNYYITSKKAIFFLLQK